MEINTQAKAMHDILLASVSPDRHPADCKFCAAGKPEEINVTKTAEEVQAEVDAAVAAATSALTAQVQELTDKLAAAQAASEGDKVAKLQAELDTAVASLATATAEIASLKTEHENVLAYLTAEHAAAEAAAAKEAVKAARIEEVEKTLKPDGNPLFPADYVKAHADRWAGFEDDAWKTQIAEYKAMAAAMGASAPSFDPVTPVTEPVVSPLTASAADTATGTPDTNALSAVLANRRSVMDLV